MQTPECETDEPVGRHELVEQLHHANRTATRLHGTIYYERAHAHLNDLLDQLVGR